KDYVRIDEGGYIKLTDSGRAIAERIYERHTLLTDMLVSLGVDEETAAADACLLEHDISDRSFECIKRHFLNRKPQ
ncbi:MAG: metal-dependent transcriptional regulator, partial [Clostridia bacterium]|nr:metal-dependent transcriptional regulator [Clostridia bacterium]